GLIARREIDDAEARMRQGDRAQLLDARAVGSAMAQRPESGLTWKRARRGNSVETENTGYATHVFLLSLASPTPRGLQNRARLYCLQCRRKGCTPGGFRNVDAAQIRKRIAPYPAGLQRRDTGRIQTRNRVETVLGGVGLGRRLRAVLA